MNDVLQTLARLPDVSFIDNLTLEDVQSTLVRLFTERYEQVTGRPLALRKGDPRTRFLYAAGAFIFQALEYVDRAGKQDLLKYAYGEYLDNQAAFWGLTRNPPASAACTLRFTLSALQQSASSIPKGTRASNGAGVYFATSEYAEIPAGQWSVDVPALAETPGAAANCIVPGALKQLVDPLPFVEKVENIDETSGGADWEDDNQLRVRTFLAPASYSTAGPTNAYVFHTLAYSAAIGSVNVSSPRPGDVDIRVLLKDGSLPSEALCEEILEHLNDREVRPLTDHVSVSAPDEIEYEVDLTYWVAGSMSDQAVSTQQAVEAAIREFNAWQTGAIGRDINPSELTRRIMEAGAKRVDIREPAFKVVGPAGVARLRSSPPAWG